MLSKKALELKNKIMKAKSEEEILKIFKKYEKESKVIGEVLWDREVLEHCNKYNTLTEDEIYSHNVYLRKKEINK